MEKLYDFFMASPQATRSQIKVGKREDFKIDMRFKFGFRKIWSVLHENES